MEHLWIGLAVMAALMQAVRTAAQKTLNQRMSILGTTYVRSVFGLPVMVAYLGMVMALAGGGLPPLDAAFITYTFLGALTQVLATTLLIRLFRLRNFAVGSMLIKVDIIMTALLGMALFSERLSVAGFAALLVVLAGVMLMSTGKLGAGALIGGALGLGAGALVGDQLQGHENTNYQQQQQINRNQSEIERNRQEIQRMQRQRGEY